MPDLSPVDGTGRFGGAGRVFDVILRELGLRSGREKPKMNFVRPAKHKSPLMDPRFLGKGDSFYFRTLDMDYGQLVVRAVAMYGVVCFVFAFITWTVSDRITVNGQNAGNGFAVALVWSVTHVITMGYGMFDPYNFREQHPDIGLFFLATLQQFVGICVNVLLFSLMVTKIQNPSAAIVFAKSALVTTRNGQRVLLCRIGNLRCNHIFMPGVRLAVLKMQHTKEGEHYMKWLPIEVTEIPVVTAVCVVEHVITEDSPLIDISQEFMESLASNADFALSLTFVGRDGVYHDEISSAHRYFRDDIMFGRLRFADTMESVIDEKTGKKRVFANFDKIGDFTEIEISEEEEEEAVEALVDDSPPIEDKMNGSSGSTTSAFLAVADVAKTIEPLHVNAVTLQFGGHQPPGATFHPRLQAEGSGAPAEPQHFAIATSPEDMGMGGAYGGASGQSGMVPMPPLLVAQNVPVQQHYVAPGVPQDFAQNDQVDARRSSITAIAEHAQQAVKADFGVAIGSAVVQSRNLGIEDDAYHGGSSVSSIGSVLPKLKANSGGVGSQPAHGNKWISQDLQHTAGCMRVLPRPAATSLAQVEADFYVLHQTDPAYVPPCIETPLPNVVYLFCGGDLRGKFHPYDTSYAVIDPDAPSGAPQQRADGCFAEKNLGILGAENGLLTKSCSVSSVVDAMLKAARIPHQCIIVDMEHKPAFFTKLGKAGTTPAILYNGTYLEESVDVVKLLVSEFGESHLRRYLELPNAAEVERLYLERHPPLPAEENAADEKSAETPTAAPATSKGESSSRAPAAEKQQEGKKEQDVARADTTRADGPPAAKSGDASEAPTKKADADDSERKPESVTADSTSVTDKSASDAKMDTSETNNDAEDDASPVVESCGIRSRPSSAGKRSSGTPSAESRTGTPKKEEGKEKVADDKANKPSGPAPADKKSGEAPAESIDAPAGVAANKREPTSDTAKATSSGAAPTEKPAVAEKSPESEKPPPAAPVPEAFHDKYRHLHLLRPGGLELPNFIMGSLLPNLMMCVKSSVVAVQAPEAMAELGGLDAEIETVEEERVIIDRRLSLSEKNGKKKDTSTVAGSDEGANGKRTESQSDDEDDQLASRSAELSWTLHELNAKRAEVMKKLEGLDRQRKVDIPGLAKRATQLWVEMDEAYKKKKGERWLHGSRMSLDDVLTLPMLNVVAGCNALLYPLAEIGWPPQLPGLDCAIDEKTGKPLEFPYDFLKSLPRPGSKPRGSSANASFARAGTTPSSSSRPGSKGRGGQPLTWEGRPIWLPRRSLVPPKGRRKDNQKFCAFWDDSMSEISTVRKLGDQSRRDRFTSPAHERILHGGRLAEEEGDFPPMWAAGAVMGLESIERALWDFQQTEIGLAIAPGVYAHLWTLTFLRRKVRKMFGGFDLPGHDIAEDLTKASLEFLRCLQNDVVIPQFVAANLRVEASLASSSCIVKNVYLRSKTEELPGGGGLGVVAARAEDNDDDDEFAFTGMNKHASREQVAAIRKALLNRAANSDSILGADASESKAVAAVKPVLFTKNPLVDSSVAPRFFEDMARLDPTSFRLIHAEVLSLSMTWMDAFEKHCRQRGGRFDRNAFRSENLCLAGETSCSPPGGLGAQPPRLQDSNARGEVSSNRITSGLHHQRNSAASATVGGISFGQSPAARRPSLPPGDASRLEPSRFAAEANTQAEPRSASLPVPLSSDASGPTVPPQEVTPMARAAYYHTPLRGGPVAQQSNYQPTYSIPVNLDQTPQPAPPPMHARPPLPPPVYQQQAAPAYQQQAPAYHQPPPPPAYQQPAPAYQQPPPSMLQQQQARSPPAVAVQKQPSPIQQIPAPSQQPVPVVAEAPPSQPDFRRSASAASLTGKAATKPKGKQLRNQGSMASANLCL
ncbi:unnamed protein product [Amoebophrya sp. A25]|nr:unnamed protein product [Amoebophrya sp. A25]|eukprot:GSA25T00021689001.1